MRRPIYLDYNATTPVATEVVAAIRPYLESTFGNPSSSHEYGQRARQAVQQARGEVAALIGAQPDDIVFTGCATEANNLAIRGVAEASTGRRRVVTTSIEHPATERPCGDHAAALTPSALPQDRVPSSRREPGFSGSP